MTNKEPIKPEISKAINAFSQNNFDEAKKLCEKLLEKESDPDANHILGCIKMREREYDDSIKLLNTALELKNDDIGILISLGCALSSNKNYDESIKIFNKIININSKISQVYFYLGESYRQTEQYAEAISSFKKCLEITPDHVGCQLILGVTYEELSDFDNAINFYKSCIESYPDYVEPHINLGMCYLLNGNYDEGWKEYEYRLKINSEFYKRKFDKPLWDGKNPEGKTILLIAEQSVGETIQYLRFAEQAAIDGAKVIIMAQDPIINFLKKQTWISEVLPYDGVIPEYDNYCYIISLAYFNDWKPDIIPQKFPYLKVDNETSDKIKTDKFNIGIVSTAPRELSNYKQIVLPEKALDNFFDDNKHNVIDLPEIDDVDDLINVINKLDLVITIEGIVPHIAGALGIRTLLLLPAVPKHTWDLNYKESTPWYPSLEIIRQKEAGKWNHVLDEVKKRVDNV